MRDNRVILVETGDPRAATVADSAGSDRLDAAAKDLVRVIAPMSGVCLPIVRLKDAAGSTRLVVGDGAFVPRTARASTQR